MKTQTPSANSKYPPSYDLKNPGDHMVAFAVSHRTVPTRNGAREVLECVIRSMPPNKLYTVWWPSGMPLPPIKSPFALYRHGTKRTDFQLSLPENGEEARAIWENGWTPPAAKVDESAIAVTAESFIPNFGPTTAK